MVKIMSKAKARQPGAPALVGREQAAPPKGRDLFRPLAEDDSPKRVDLPG